MWPSVAAWVGVNAAWPSSGANRTGATLALWAVAAIAVFVGHRAGTLLDPHVTKKVAAVLFALVGAALFGGVL